MDGQSEIERGLVAFAKALGDRLTGVDQALIEMARGLSGRLDRIERALVVIAECVEPDQEPARLMLNGEPDGGEREAGTPL